MLFIDKKDYEAKFEIDNAEDSISVTFNAQRTSEYSTGEAGLYHEPYSEFSEIEWDKFLYSDYENELIQDFVIDNESLIHSRLMQKGLIEW